MIVANIGLSIKLGKHNTHLSWYDAQNEALRKVIALDGRSVEPIICERGDADKDRKSTRLNSSHLKLSRMPSSA